MWPKLSGTLAGVLRRERAGRQEGHGRGCGTLAKAKGTARALDEAGAVAAQRGASEDKDMSGRDLAAVVKAVYLISEQPGSRSSHNTKGKALAFLGELGLPWAGMLPGARACCDAAVAKAEAAVAKAKVVAVAALAHGPVGPPSEVEAAPAAAPAVAMYCKQRLEAGRARGCP